MDRLQDISLDSLVKDSNVHSLMGCPPQVRHDELTLVTVRWNLFDFQHLFYHNRNQPVKRRRALLASNPIKE